MMEMEQAIEMLNLSLAWNHRKLEAVETNLGAAVTGGPLNASKDFG